MIIMTKKMRIQFATAVAIAALAIPFASQAGSLENLERERALTLQSMLDPELQPQDRQKKLTSAKVRLIDLERMVLRDKKLKGRNTPTVRKAFENYDLTFLVHSATEKNMSVLDNWLDQLGVTSQSVMSATLRRR